jgi:hypothetical protein
MSIETFSPIPLEPLHRYFRRAAREVAKSQRRRVLPGGVLTRSGLVSRRYLPLAGSPAVNG